ncbi:hypothetical protein P8605_18635 [Streptomyces sp. T-3]|nr:hypothetical protein [Streptomyces sp. T-3]
MSTPEEQDQAGAEVSTLLPHTTLLDETFVNGAGNWVGYQSAGVSPPTWPLVVVDDAAATGKKALQFLKFGMAEHKKNFAYDPLKTYTLSYTLRLKTPPTVETEIPYVYLGLTGVQADLKTRCNIAGDSTLSGQHYFAARKTKTDSSTYQTITGYARLTANPSPGGPNNDKSKPGPMHPSAPYFRALVYMLYGCNSGEQLLDRVTIHVQDSLGISGTAGPPDINGQCPVTLQAESLWTFGTDYDGFNIYKNGGSSIVSRKVAVPGTITDPKMIQAPGETAKWRLGLWKTGQPVFDYREITITTPPLDGPVLVRSQDSTQFVWCDIQQWPEQARDRGATVLPVMGRTTPVVIYGALQAPRSTITFLTRTLDQYDQLVKALNSAGTPYVQIPSGYPGVRSQSIVPLTITETRLTNDGTDERRLVAVEVQGVI